MIAKSSCCFLRLLKDSFDRSCSDVVVRVCWTKDFCGLKDTCSSCILVVKEKPSFELSFVA